jgi:hypothetical protein
VNPTEREKVELCASCGEQGASKKIPELDNAVLCKGCADRLTKGEILGYWRSEETPPLSSEERFAELEKRFAPLIKAAQVLRRESKNIAKEEGIDEEDLEDLIYPTLAFANELAQGIADLEEEAVMLVSSAENDADWEAAVERFSRTHSGLVPVKVVDGIVILRWLPVDGDVRFYPLPGAKIPEVVTIRIRLHTSSLEPGLISRVYETILSANEVSYGKFMTSSTDHAFAGNELFISSYASTDTATRIPSEHAAAVFGDRAPEFAPPDFVEKFGRLLIGSGREKKPGFDRRLNRRKGGPSPTSTKSNPERPVWFIAACVAHFLKQHGGLPEGIEAHRLLNKHVLPDKTKIPVDYGSQTTSESVALWRSAEKAGEMLEVAVRAIYDQEFTT